MGYRPVSLRVTPVCDWMGTRLASQLGKVEAIHASSRCRWGARLVPWGEMGVTPREKINDMKSPAQISRASSSSE